MNNNTARNWTRGELGGVIASSLAILTGLAIIALVLVGCGAPAPEDRLPKSTPTPVSFVGELGDVLEHPEPVVEVPAPVVEIPLDESGAPVESEPAPQPAPAPAPAPAPVQPPPPVLCPGGSSAIESDGYNETSCMRSTADNGGSCFEGDNGMLPECQPFRP